MASTSKAIDGLADVRRESGLHLINRVKQTTDPPGDSFIQDFDSHIIRAFPKLEQTLPKSSWARGDIIEIQGPAASGKTHLLYFWAMTCVLPYRMDVNLEGYQEKKDVLIVRRLNAIISSYLRDRLGTILPQDTPESYDRIISQAVINALKRVHLFRPDSTLSLATTLMAIPTYHRTGMADEQIGMLMVDGISSFYWSDRWLSEQIENEPAEVQTTAPQPPPPPPLRSDANPLRHVLTVILNLRRSLGLVALLTNWGLAALDSQVPPSTVYFRQHLRAPYPSPFESEPRASKFSLTHHITIPLQGPEPLRDDVLPEDETGDQEREDQAERSRAMARTIGKRPGEARTVIESELEFTVTESGISVS
ncbi:hypothetical protein RhiXN_10589 [Rhizoctonia solani]|uniref:DNA recombination and repair protein Rad51-like C-terminal domain-containing protein n=1 Tax=Rhizoctonia solani TaxID=456999 RepID=A0A8H8P2Z4_9AGAM|nr:uncharacterized protein RhiXN_10589 [Rhizoctonia solani]QRW24265.1 hypothetical protein RhiXN_10589 [Rhizoctonia solani]